MTIRTNDLRKSFGRTPVLDGVSLNVKDGSVFGLVGPNGAGKTTCIKILMNLIPADSGTAEILGFNSRRIGVPALRQIGYVSENQELPRWMTIDYFLRYLKPFYPSWEDGLAEELLNQFALPRTRKIRDLSRGMHMKVALVAALAYRPKVLILDEPFSGLDALVRDEFIGGLLERAEGMTIFISSHDLAEIESFASHIGYLDNGRLQFSEEIQDLSNRFREVEVTLEAPPPLPARWPNHWMAPETGSAVVRFVETRFDAQRSEAEIRDVSRRPQSRSASHVAPVNFRHDGQERPSTGGVAGGRQRYREMLIHILRKDAREHWISIALAAAVIITSGLSSTTMIGGHGYLELLTAAVWVILIGRLVQSEPIPGDRHYWLTRPVPRGVLLSAKLLGAVLFLHVPHLISDALALLKSGFNPVEHVGGLLWKQFLGFAGCTAPLLALAAVTRTFAHYVLALLGVGVAAVIFGRELWQLDFHWMGLHWVKGLAERSAALGVGLAILGLQYFHRSTLASRMLVGLGAGIIASIAAFSPWSVAYAIQQRVNPSGVQPAGLLLTFDSGRTLPPYARSFLPQVDERLIMLPVKWSGVPEGTEIVPDRTVASIRLSNGEVLRPRARSTLNWGWETGQSYASFSLHEDLLQRVGTQTVDIDVRMFVTLYGKATADRMPASQSGHMVAGVGQCLTERSNTGFWVRCRSAFKNTRLMARLHDQGNGDSLEWKRLAFDASHTPLPTELSLGSPFRTASLMIQRTPVVSERDVEFLVREPVAHLELPMTVQGITLAQFATRR